VSRVEPGNPDCGATMDHTGEEPTPLWVHIMTTQEVVAVGLRTILQQAPGNVRISATAPDGALHDAEADVVLYDAILLHDLDSEGHELERLLTRTSSIVIVVDRTLRRELGVRARQMGVEWAIDLGITGDELVDVIEGVISGHLEEAAAALTWEADDHLGASQGLSPRESQVLELVVQGHSNQEIAALLFLSPNSIKTYIRSAYRKIGVTSRAQAVAWGIQHGFPVEQAGLAALDSADTTPR
jgi:DNA-binding NarL/FixJ family response regulator